MDFGPPFGLSIRLDVDSHCNPIASVELGRKFDRPMMLLLLYLTYFYLTIFFYENNSLSSCHAFDGFRRNDERRCPEKLAQT